MKRPNSNFLLALAVLVAGSSVQINAAGQSVWYQDVIKKIQKRLKRVDSKTYIIGAMALGCTAVAGLIWWVVYDHRSDEQVIADVQKLINSTNHKYENNVQLLASAHLTSFSVLNESLLHTFIERGVDTYYLYYLNRTVDTINKELSVLSLRLERSKIEHVCKRMKIMSTDLQQLLQHIQPLQQFLQYHASYMQLCRTVTELQRIYNQPCGYKTSQKKLVQYVATQGSAFASYPYFDYVEKLERSTQRLKSEMNEASYAKNSNLYRSAHELYEQLLIVKGTLASTTEYREDVQKRERARIKLQQEQAHLAQQIAAQQHALEMQREQDRMQQERDRLARQQRELERQRQHDKEKEDAAQREKKHQQKMQELEQERAEQKQRHEQQMAELARQRQQREEQERQAWLYQQSQAAAHDEYMRQQSYQKSGVYPSAPPAQEYGMPEPSAPSFGEEPEPTYSDADLDTMFTTMEQNLAHETGESAQFQKDFGHGDEQNID